MPQVDLQRFRIRVREGKTWERMVPGTGPGEFSMVPFGVEIHGSRLGQFTLIPWSNVVIVEPTT